MPRKVKTPKLFKKSLKGGDEGGCGGGMYALLIFCFLLVLGFGIPLIWALVKNGWNLLTPRDTVGSCDDLPPATDAYCSPAGTATVAPEGAAAVCEDKINPKYGTKPLCHCKTGYTGAKCNIEHMGTCTIKAVGEIGEEPTLVAPTVSKSLRESTRVAAAWKRDRTTDLATEDTIKIINTEGCFAGKCTKSACDAVKYCETVIGADAGGCIARTAEHEAAADAAAQGALADTCGALTAEACEWGDATTYDSAGVGATIPECKWEPATLGTQSGDCLSDQKVAVWIPNYEQDIPTASSST